jgi:hypothetical protein
VTSPWLDSKTPVGPPTSANPTVRQLLYAALVTGGWSGLSCLVIYLIARLAGMTFAVSGSVAEALEPVTWLLVLLVPLGFAVVFALLAALLRGLAQAGRITFWAGTLVAILSLIAPLTQPAEVGWFTRVVLSSMHLVTWFLVVPQIARIIGDSEPGASAERTD